MGDAATKGTATPLGAVFSPEETARAAARVDEAVSGHRSELSRLRGFVADNAALVSLVQRLPDELSHDIMVPFGGAAFFPGRLIHTNELMVLLGEGYYAERTVKQTIEILARRGKALEAQVEGLKVTISDLEAEAKFFKSTAAEAAEGLVEIREEYVEEAEGNLFESGAPISSNEGTLDENKEHARIMARLAELEKEEQEAGSASEDDEDESAVTSEDDKDSEEEEDAVSDDDEDNGASFGFSTSGNVGDNLRHAAQGSALKQGRGEEMLKEAPLGSPLGKSQLEFPDHASIMKSEVRFPAKAVSFQDHNMQLDSTQKSPSLLPDQKYSAMRLEDSSENIADHGPKIISSGQKAFTGSIIEHTDDLPVTQLSKSTALDKPSSSTSSKPVSRFKMQKGGH